MYHPVLCILTDATLPSFPSDFRLPSCDVLLKAVSSVFSHRSEHRLTKRSLLAPPNQDFIHLYACEFHLCCLSSLTLSLYGFFWWFPGFFFCLIIRNNKGIALFPSIPMFSLSYPKLHFWRFFTLLAHESNVKPALCSIHWRWRLCIFLPFSHNINSLYPIWIIGRLTAIWKSRWCFPDLPPPSLSWLKGS